MKIIRNKILAPLTTFGIGGKADYFCEAHNQNEIIKAINWANNRLLPYFILGGGSNILVGDKGIRGLVIKIKNEKLKMKNDKSKFKIIAHAGVQLSKLVQIGIKHQLSGLEDMAGVPGTVGGAIVGNAGTSKGSISQTLDEVTALGIDGKIHILKPSQCNFSHRTSRFQKSQEIILETTFKLSKKPLNLIKQNISQALKTRIGQPKGKSAGSIFKNPKNYFAGELIDKAGLKGVKIGQAIISPVHANWIINQGGAKASDVLKLIKMCKQEVYKKFKIRLEEEIQIVGE